MCCEDGSAGEQVLTLFDANGDCTVTTEELLASDLVDGTIRNPDLDLFDGDSDEFNPNQDGVKDSISLGVGFSAVAGTFDVP